MKTVLGGTSFLTTVLAPTTLPFPIVTFEVIVQFAPIQHPFLKIILPPTGGPKRNELSDFVWFAVAITL